MMGENNLKCPTQNFVVLAGLMNGGSLAGIDANINDGGQEKDSLRSARNQRKCRAD